MKHCTTLLITLLLTLSASAQKIFFRAGAGYAWPLSNSKPVYLTGFPYTGGNANPDDAGLFEVKKASMFSGGKVVAGAGLMFNRIGFDLAVAAIAGNVSYSFSGSLGAIYAPTSNTVITQTTKNPIMLMPAALMKVPGRRMDIFLRAGVALPINNKIYVESETIDGANRYYDKSQLKTQFSIGFTFSGGVEYKITKSLRAFAGIDIITMTVKAKELNLLSSVDNGTDVLSTKFAYQKKTLYVDDLSDYAFSSNEPRKVQAYSIPFGSKGISIGFLYQL